MSILASPADARTLPSARRVTLAALLMLGTLGLSPAAASASGGLNPPPKVNMADAVAAAGLEVKPNTKIAPPPAKANPNWIQF